MEKRKKTENDQKRNNGANNCDPIRETGSCEEQEKVDSRDSNFSSVDDQTSYGQDAPCIDSPHGDEAGINLSHLSSAVDALLLGASRTSNVDLNLDRKQETEEDDRPEGAAGGESRDGVLEAKATVSNDGKALVLYDSSNDKDTDDEDEGEISMEEKTCFSCGKVKQTMKKCGACGHATYCDKTCQKADWKKGHKKSCGNYRRFLAQLSKPDMLKYQLRHGPLHFRMSMEFIKDPVEVFMASALLFGHWRRKQFVLLEVVGRHPHFFRPGCVVQDVHGNRTHILFYTGPITVLTPPFPFPFPLEHFLEPGKFIWLLEPVWHNFLDGTVGIRINHPDEFELP